MIWESVSLALKKTQTNLPSHTKTTELHGKVHGSAGITMSKMNLPSHNIWKVKLISSINRLPVFQGRVLPKSLMLYPDPSCNFPINAVTQKANFFFFFFLMKKIVQQCKCKYYFSNLFGNPFHQYSKIQIVKLTYMNFLNLLKLLFFTRRIRSNIFLKFY